MPDPDVSYRLMALSVDERADETMSTFTVAEDATLAGVQVGTLGLTVLAVETADGTTETLPADGREMVAGGQLFVIANPSQLRRRSRCDGSGAVRTAERADGKRAEDVLATAVLAALALCAEVNEIAENL